MTDNNLIARTGHALYGDTWQSEMARALGTAPRTIRRYAAGEYSPPAGVYVDLLRIAIARRVGLDEAILGLKQRGDPL